MIINKIKEFFIKSHQNSRRDILKENEIQEIEKMFITLTSSNNLMTKPSKYWLELNKMNFVQLKENGFENFKRTIALNYFTWVRIMPWDSQIIFLLKNLKFQEIKKCFFFAIRAPKQDFFSSFNFIQSILFNFLTSLMWQYIINLKLDYNTLQEPTIGNPPLINFNNRQISQDIINSLLEYDSIMSNIESSKPVSSILELGAGYGRNAYVFLKLNPNAKYIIVDIPPALWVAQKYLKECFPDRKIFEYQEFENFNKIENEFNNSHIIFLLSSQLELLPRNLVDICINISSFHEMRLEQINYYLQQFSMITKPKGYFYIKQWKIGHVLFENTIIRENDYPIPNDFSKVYSRVARVQTKFFEALYQKK
ncbi:MAG: putative sugar O-methyltransferase [Leptospiraceae bacterium]|nr:putative sugar O-methyltransferase [Leptospiraceae bacterium]